MSEKLKPDAITNWWNNTVLPMWYSIDWSDPLTIQCAIAGVFTVIGVLSVFWMVFRMRRLCHENAILRRHKIANDLKDSVAAARAKVGAARKEYNNAEDAVSGLMVKAMSEALAENTAKAVDAVSEAYKDASRQLIAVQNNALEALQVSHKRSLRLISTVLDIFRGTSSDDLRDLLESMEKMEKEQERIGERIDETDDAINKFNDDMAITKQSLGTIIENVDAVNDVACAINRNFGDKEPGDVTSR